MGEDEEESLRPTKKIKRVTGGGRYFSHVKSMGLTEYRYLQVPNSMWAKELNEEEKKYVVVFNSKVRHNEDSSGLSVLHRFSSIIDGREKRNLPEGESVPILILMKMMA
eukprot:703875-Ditylum_brightwellii.AAC.1